jgi:hypothetical protein
MVENLLAFFHAEYVEATAEKVLTDSLPSKLPVPRHYSTERQVQPCVHHESRVAGKEKDRTDLIHVACCWGGGGGEGIVELKNFKYNIDTPSTAPRHSHWYYCTYNIHVPLSADVLQEYVVMLMFSPLTLFYTPL